MNSYKFVAAAVAVLGVGIFMYKSCSGDVPNIGGLGTLIPNNATIKPKKPKPTTHVDTTTTTVSTPGGTTTTTIVDKTVINAPRRLRIDIGMSTPWLQPKGPRTYDLGLSYRIFDHVWVGGTITQEKAIGVKFGVEL